MMDIEKMNEKVAQSNAVTAYAVEGDFHAVHLD